MKHYTEFNYKDLLIGRNKTIKSILTLDLEVTSVVTEEGHKEGYVYMWMVGVDHNIYYGRDLLELKTFITIINTYLKGREAYMYVHNLSYDFQFLRNIFQFDDVFCRQVRKPLKARFRDTTINLRCSYMLTNKSLSDLTLTYNLPIKKLHYDYNKYRDVTTPLTDDELQYCENDCLIIYKYLELVEIPRWGSIAKIPLTKTGKVRKDFKKSLGRSAQFFASDNRHISAQGVDIHLLLKKAFTGGYIHANPYIVDTTLDGVESWDITSSYPFVMLTEGFPCGSFYKMQKPDITMVNQHQCYLMRIRIIEPITVKNFPYLSFSKLDSSYNAELDNGRVVSADWLEVTCTEVDLDLINDCYTYDSIEVLELWVAPKSWLPKKFIKFILEKAKIKQDLKRLYKLEPTTKNKQLLTDAKVDLNSLFGMTVTNNLRDDVTYECNTWGTTPMDINRLHHTIETRESQGEYDMFPYAWGVWITAYARRNILKIVYNFDDTDIYYIDTDCLKFKTKENSDLKNAILAYNKECEPKLLKMCKKFDIDHKDVDFDLGKYMHEGSYEQFRTLGSKKYMFKKDGKLELHYSGLSRSSVKSFNSIDDFTEGRVIDSGVLNVYYNDNQTNSMYKYGVYMETKEITLSSIALERPSDKIDSEYYYYL